MDTTHHNTAETWVAGYADYLRDAVGAADATRARHLPTVRRFIAACSGPGGPDWTGLSVQQVAEFIRQEAAQRTGYGRKAPACVQISEFSAGGFGSNRQAISVETDRPFRSKAAPDAAAFWCPLSRPAAAELILACPSH
jgi:hypothetical protein